MSMPSRLPSAPDICLFGPAQFVPPVYLPCTPGDRPRCALAACRGTAPDSTPRSLQTHECNQGHRLADVCSGAPDRALVLDGQCAMWHTTTT